MDTAHEAADLMAGIQTLLDVVDWELCIGCGACAYACDKAPVAMFDIPDVGLRPRLDEASCSTCTDCLAFCPGSQIDADVATGPRPRETEADHEFGPVLEIWEGYAADPAIRFAGSSGGALTAIALYCIEQKGLGQVLHAGMDAQRPWLNETRLSFDRSDLIAQAGSRYAPSSPCAGLAAVADASASSVFIGKPCDAAATQTLRLTRPELDEKLGVVLTFFCAGTPSTAATLELVDELGVAKDAVESLRYRGEGWPGRFRVATAGGAEAGSMSYAESWGKVNKHRTLRCHLCPDGLGRTADISCGDAWHRHGGGEFGESENPDPGRSLILVNTERGREILHGAMEAGYLELESSGAAEVVEAQGLLDRRRQLFGRMLALKLLARPLPRFLGFSLFRGWRALPLGAQLRSVLGTLRRALQKGWHRRESPAWQSRAEDCLERKPRV